jgi:hypothetical protein
MARQMLRVKKRFMHGVRPYVLANLAKWTRLPVGSPFAVDQLRQQLHALEITDEDKEALRLAAEALTLAEEIHLGIGDEPEYAKRARLNYVLVRLCWHIESSAGSGIAREPSRAAQPPLGA